MYSVNIYLTMQYVFQLMYTVETILTQCMSALIPAFKATDITLNVSFKNMDAFL